MLTDERNIISYVANQVTLPLMSIHRAPTDQDHGRGEKSKMMLNKDAATAIISRLGKSEKVNFKSLFRVII